MLVDSINLRSIYVELQKQIFDLIPEKWNKIYLYASVSNTINNIETGEMFFYYFPKGILKKNPINVYEVPEKFNIEENSYLKFVDELYDTIKRLKTEFSRQNNNEEWSSITIIIENNKFTIKYNFEDLIGSKYTSYDRHIIWKYEYLNMPIEVLNRKDRQMLENYYEDLDNKKIKQEEYTEGLYSKVHNVIEYNRQDVQEQANAIDKKENSKIKKEERKINQLLKKG